MMDTMQNATGICVCLLYIYPDLLLVLWQWLVIRQSCTPLFEMHRGAEKASGLTEAIRSIISTTVEGLMRTIVSV